MGSITKSVKPALNKIPALVAGLRLRPARKQAIMALLTAMIRSVNLQYDGLIAHVSGSEICPKPLAELAAMAGLSYSRAKRAMTDCYRLDFVVSHQLRKRGNSPNTLAVSAGLRWFTPTFWRKLCLGYNFERAVKQAKERKKYFFSLPLKNVAYNWPLASFSSAKSLLTKWRKSAQKSAKHALKQVRLLFGPSSQPAPTTRPPVPPPTSRPAPPPIEAPPPEIVGNARAAAWANLIRDRLRSNKK